MLELSKASQSFGLNQGGGFVAHHLAVCRVLPQNESQLLLPVHGSHLVLLILHFVLDGAAEAVECGVLIFVVLFLAPQVLRVLEAGLAAVRRHSKHAYLDELLHKSKLLLAEVMTVELSGAVKR